MGLDANGTKFLLFARKRGVDLAETATIGRQSLLADAAALEANFRDAGTPLGAVKVRELLERGGGYSEEFLRALGAGSVTSFDASDYENASVVHDMNAPIPDEFKDRFTAVLDGGTLEHVFNYPQALRNCMEMVRPGGHFLAITPTSNFSGHGFYQFSPELFWNVLSDANGFDLEELALYEDAPGSPWYKVADPRVVRRRVWMITSRPAYLVMIARKTETVELFRSMPQQSDYAAAWESYESTGSAGELYGDARPRPLPRRILGRVARVFRGRGTRLDPQLFSRFDPLA